MLKKIREKKVRAFKEIFPVHQVSKKGNLYFRHRPHTKDLDLYFGGHCVVKGTFDKLGTKEVRKLQTQDAIFLIDPRTGKQLIKHREGNIKRMTLKDVIMYPILTNIFFPGRKFEYLINYKKLWVYPLAQNFTSLKGFKTFLGYDFLSDDDFYAVFSNCETFDYILLMGMTNDKHNLIKLLKSKSHSDPQKNNYLTDYIEMCVDANVKPNIPAGMNKLIQRHDDLVLELNMVKLAVASKDVQYLEKRVDTNNGRPYFTDYWDSIGLSYRRLNTQYDMLMQGIKQSHCIGSNYSHRLKDYSFYTIKYQGMEYDLQIYPSGMIGQFYGKKNTYPAMQIKVLVINNDVSYEHKIVENSEVDIQPIQKINLTERNNNLFDRGGGGNYAPIAGDRVGLVAQEPEGEFMPF